MDRPSSPGNGSSSKPASGVPFVASTIPGPWIYVEAEVLPTTSPPGNPLAGSVSRHTHCVPQQSYGTKDWRRRRRARTLFPNRFTL